MRVISITQTGSLGIKRRSVKPELKLGSISVRFLTVLIFAVLAIFYLVQSQLSTGKRQEIKRYQTEKENLMSVSEDLTLESNQLKSISALEASAQSMQMTEATNIIYAAGK